MGAILALGTAVALAVTIGGLVVGLIVFAMNAARRQMERRRQMWAAVAAQHGLSYNGYEIVGRKLETLMPESLRDLHSQHRRD